MKKVLMIAYHFPPLAGSSGIQRTLRFAQQLPELGWEPIVLTADPRAYERTSDDLLGEVPAGLVVKRAFALDTARQLSFGGRYLGWLARPDRWMTWRFGAVSAGLALIRQHAPDVLKRMAQATACLLIACATPQQCGELGSQMSCVGFQREIRNKRLDLLGAETKCRARACARLEPTEQREP